MAQSGAREILATLVGMDTSIGRGNVPKAAEYLAGRLRAGGFAASDVHVFPLGETASLVARYPGSGTGGRPIAFLAHMDVVPAKRQDWKRDPYALSEEGGNFFGRGTLDVKGEVAVLTETFLRLKAEGFVPTRDLVLAFTGDEETEELTAQDLTDHHRELVDAEFALNADGGGGTLAESDGRAVSYTIQGAEKSSASYRLTVRNPGGHSSMPRPDNAIYELADALEKLRAFRFPVQWNDWTLEGFKAASAATPGALGDAMKRFAAHPGDSAAADEIAKRPTLAGLVRTTCVATMLEGGHAENALPQSATATVNCRIFPGTTPAAVQDALQKVVGRRVEITLPHEPHASDASPMRKDVVEAVTHAVHALHPGVVVAGAMAPYATDGAVFRNARIPTYGTSGTFIKESDLFPHGLDERVPVSSFYDSLKFWDVVIHDLAGAK